MPPEVIAQIPTIDIDAETLRYGIDQFLIRVDQISWAFGALVTAIIVKIAANPIGYVLDRLTYGMVSVIGALRKPVGSEPR